MNSYAILCLDNNPICAEQYQDELAQFADCFDVHCVESLTEARQTLDYIHDQNRFSRHDLIRQHPSLSQV